MVHGNKKPPGRLTPGSNNSSGLEHTQPTLGNGTGGGASSSSSNGNANNNANGGARQTGTVPKTKASRKNSVPQEIVAPTRRDLQQHLTELVHWASTAPSPTNANTQPGHQHQHHHHQQQQQQQHHNGGIPGATTASKQRNIRTPGEGTCFDLDNFSLQDHAANSRFIPVRPIVRGSYLSDDLSAEHLPTSNTTIGVVIPTTPSQQQQQQQNHQDSSDPIWQHIISPLTRQRPNGGGGGLENRSTAFRIIPDGAPAQPTPSRQSTHSSRGSSQRTATNRQLDDRISEIQDYIRATSSLINTINQEKTGSGGDDKMVNTPINSMNLETLADGSESETNGPRPQSVASIHSTPTPGTPDCDDLQQRLQSSTRNMQMIREQQNQILRMQQAAKSQLEDMEKERCQNPPSSLLTQEEPPNYETATQVHDDVSNLMNRMRSLSTFVDNQNELANMLGEDLMTDEILAEQAMLQKKVQELQSKRGQMVDLVNELQSMNSQAELSFSGGDLAQAAGPDMEALHHPIQNADSGASLDSEATLMNCNDLDGEVDNNDSELCESESLASGQNSSVVSEKLAEINAMKEQLKRLQNMMNTVKLIENKVNGPDPVEMAQASREVDRLISEIPPPRRNVSVVAEKPQPEPAQAPSMNSAELEPVLSERVQALHAMTADLRVQAISLAAERDRLRSIKDEMIRRKAEEQREDERQSERSNSTIRESAPGATSLNYNHPSNNNNFQHETSEQRKLRDEFEMKKREYESVLEKMQNVGRRSEPRQMDLFDRENQESVSNVLSKKMQNDQMGFGGQSPAAQSAAWRRTTLAPSQQQHQQHQQLLDSIAELQNHHEMFQQQHNVQANGSNGASNYGQQQQEQNMFMSGMVDGAQSFRGDSLLLQQFIQTQQMLINSISQCNQLLWAQQRELNNLNNAVLMLQERLLKHELSATVDNSLNMSGPNLLSGSNNRSESVPPPSLNPRLLGHGGGASNILHEESMGNPVSYMRAQSEQPSSAGQFFRTSTANFGNAPQTPLSPVRIYPMYNNQSMMRSGNGQSAGGHQQMQGPTSNLIHLNNNLAGNNTNNLNNANLNNITNNLANNRIARVTGNVQIPHMQDSGNGCGQNGDGGNHHLFGNNILNLNPLNNNLSSNVGPANMDHLPPIHHHFGGHHNMHSHPHLMNHHSQQPTLNNQVAPGNRANNYWDNFRSYSRQNLLSGNSCKSNEESCASSTSNYQPTASFVAQQPLHQLPHHRLGGSSFSMPTHPNHQQQQQQQHFRNALIELHQGAAAAAGADHYGLNNNYSQAQQSQSTNNNLNSIVNNLCRNNNNLILDIGAGHVHPSTQQQHQQHSHDGAQGTTFPTTNMTLAADILGFHTNPINLGVNAEFAAKSKTLPKGNKKRTRSMANNSEAPLVMPSTSRNAGNVVDEEDEEEANLNLASATSTNVRSKSTSKFFEALKENVRCEVSALIETNDLRPYFLIQLFRDLQLMSSSDPTRHQTLQSIQNMYNRYVESTIQGEVTMFGGAAVAHGGQLNSMGDVEEDDDRQNVSNDEVDNRMLVNDLRMEAKTENDLSRQNREIRRRDNQVEDSLRRQNKRRYRNRVNEIANKQNVLEQRLGLSFPTSSASSHSTPIRSVFNDMLQMTVNGERCTEQFIPQATSSSDSSSLSVSTDCEIIRIVMKEIAEYLQSIEPINIVSDGVLQRVATIIVSHLNNALNERLLLTNFRRIDREDLMAQLRVFAAKRGKFLRRIEQYLQGRFVDGPIGQSVRGERDGGVENQEVLHKSQKKLNNEPDGAESQSLKESVATICAIEAEQPDEMLEEDGAMGNDVDQERQQHNSSDPTAEVTDNDDQLIREECVENNESPEEVSRDNREDEAKENETIWATDEEVEVLSTNDGPAN